MSQNFMEVMLQGPKDIVTAHRIVQSTIYVSLFVILLTAGFAITGVFHTSTDATIQYLLDPWLLFDVFLMLIFTFFLYKRKLWAAIGLVTHQLLGAVVLYIDLDQLPGALGLLKLALFISAVRAVYRINQEGKKPEEQLAELNS